MPAPDRIFGWRPDRPDPLRRDRRYKAVLAPGETLPRDCDQRPGLPPAWNQGRAGSCTGYGTSGAVSYVDPVHFQGSEALRPSPRFAYWNGRDYEGATAEDAGASIRDVIKGINRYGVCHESDCPYDERLITTKPSDGAFAGALLHQSLVYERVDQTEYSLRHCLAKWVPVVFGMLLYESFNHRMAVDAVIPVPNPDKEQPLGGHCMLLCGYFDEPKLYVVRNSWGKDWGREGYCFIPYDVIHNEGLCSDFWAIDKMES